jgi:hypothetical protein
MLERKKGLSVRADILYIYIYSTSRSHGATCATPVTAPASHGRFPRAAPARRYRPGDHRSEWLQGSSKDDSSGGRSSMAHRARAHNRARPTLARAGNLLRSRAWSRVRSTRVSFQWVRRPPQHEVRAPLAACAPTTRVLIDPRDSRPRLAGQGSTVESARDATSGEHVVQGATPRCTASRQRAPALRAPARRCGREPQFASASRAHLHLPRARLNALW